MAVPGPVTSAMSAGCHALLAAETAPALLVTSVADVVNVIGGPSDMTDAPAAGRTNRHPRCRSSLRLARHRRRRQVFDGLPARRAVDVDELAVITGRTPVEVMRSLPALEMAGLVVAADGGYRVSPFVRRGRGRGHAARA